MLDFGLALGSKLSSQQAKCIQALFGGEIVEARGWAVVQLSHADTLCRQLKLCQDARAAVQQLRISKTVQGEAACREARSLRRFAGCRTCRHATQDAVATHVRFAPGADP